MSRSARLASFLLSSLLAASLVAMAGARVAVGEDATAAPGASARKPFLWVVEGTPRIYLFGTIHIPDPRVLELSSSTKAAIADSDMLLGELALDELMSLSVAAMKAIEAPEGKKLADLVPKDVMERLEKYLADRKQPLDLVATKNPMGAAITLLQIEMGDLLKTRMPMDIQFQLDAKKAGKATGGLETAQEQLAALTSPPLDAQARLLDSAVKSLAEEHAAGRNPFDALIAAYTKGDMDALSEEMKKADPMDDPEFKALMKRLVGDRNAIMVDRLLEKTAAAPTRTYFVFVGAAHYAGPDGILALLEKKGKKLRRLGADDKIPAKEPVAVPAVK